MKQKQHRCLRSKAGSSLLLALAFFLLCSFVGSTVLAAAAGNAGRMAGLRQQRQDYFSQRSAAAVLEEQLSEELKLTIKKETTTVTTKTANDLGGVTVIPGDPSYAIECSAPAGQKALDTLLYQAAANAYRESGDAGANPNVNFVGFPASVHNNNWGSLHSSTGSGSIALTMGSEALETQPFGYTCDDGYGFTLAPGGENAQLHLYLPASVTKTSVTTAVEVEVTGNTSTETETKTQTITISWQAPVVRKGDSE